MPKLKISDIKEKYLLFPECILDIEVLQERVSLLKTFFSYAIQKKDLKMAINLYKFLMQRSEELNYQSFNSHLNALFYLLVEEKKNQIYMEKASESPELASPANAMIPDLDILVQELFTSFTKSDSTNENMYTLMIKYYCSCGKHDMAYNLIDEMVKQKHQPHLRSYRYLIKSAPDLITFNKVYSRLKNQPLKPDTEFFELIFNWLNRNNHLDFKIWETFLSDYQEIHRKLTKNIATLVMKSFEEKCSTTEISKNGVALETGDTLQSIDVTPTQKKNLAALVYYNSNHSNGSQVFIDFNKFIKKQNFDYDIVVDGANVGLYNNQEYGAWRLMKVCQYFMTRGKKILIILNHKRKTEELKIFAEVSKKNLLIYYAPSGVNDDLVWLYASLRIEGKKSSEIYVVTNDKMTDHIYYTFPEYFKTWMERHQVNFDFDKKTKRLTIIEPTIYSNRIQTVEGKWYFPVEGTRKWLYF